MRKCLYQITYLFVCSMFVLAAPWIHHGTTASFIPLSTNVLVPHYAFRKSTFKPSPFKALFFKDSVKQSDQETRRTFDKSLTPKTPRDEDDVDVDEEFLIPGNDIYKHSTMGLTYDQVNSRLDTYGPNSLTPPPKKSLWDLWLEQFQDRLVQILLVVAFTSTILSVSEFMDKVSFQEFSVSGSTGGGIVFTRETFLELIPDFVEPLIILLILIINAAIGVSQQVSAIASIDALEQLQPRLATVLRKGRGGDDDSDCDDKSEWVVRVDASTLVPGDIIRLKVGNIVPADAKLLHLESSIMTTDESNLTGESNSVEKIPCDFKALTKTKFYCADTERHLDLGTTSISEQENMLFSSTMVTSGSGTALVIRTGMHTEIGKIQVSVMSVEDRKTPLREKLDDFGDDLSSIIALIW